MTKPRMRKVYRLFYFLNTDILPDIQDPNFIFAQVIRYHSEQVAQTVESVLQFSGLCLVRIGKNITILKKILCLHWDKKPMLSRENAECTKGFPENSLWMT